MSVQEVSLDGKLHGLVRRKSGGHGNTVDGLLVKIPFGNAHNVGLEAEGADLEVSPSGLSRSGVNDTDSNEVVREGAGRITNILATTATASEITTRGLLGVGDGIIQTLLADEELHSVDVLKDMNDLRAARA